MHTRYRILGPCALFLGLLLTVVSLSPTSTLAQRTAETVESASSSDSDTRMTTETSESAPKSAHTPATTLENSNGDIILQSSKGGSFLVPGQGGAIPAEGAGSRMMWYADQSAFRAGRVTGSNWDADSIGTYSVALGDETKAKGNFGSVAMGDETAATGLSALAVGFGSVASGDNSTAMGDDTEAAGTNSTTMGDLTKASGNEALAIGNETRASAVGAVAMGENTTASGQSATAMGLDTEASGTNSVAMGTMSTANDSNAVAMGFDTITGPDHSLVSGRCNLNTSGIFVVGNGPLNSAGDGCDTFSDALVLAENGDLEITGSLTENSDRRLKTDIEPVGEEVLGALQEIDPVRFRFEDERTHPAGEQIGLIAQEVQNEFPELVTERGDGMLSLSYTKFSAVLLKGLQEQQSTIDQHEERIATLEAENEEIKERLAALEAEQSSPATAGLVGPWGLAFLLGLGGLAGGLLWRRNA